MTDSLKEYNSFGLNATCNKLIHIASVADLQSFLSENLDPFFILGGGSNILLPEHLALTVVRNELMGKRIISEDDNEAIVQIGGGENWHEFVLWSIAHGLGGVENLSLIPGTVGAAPMQNIGAYGVEIKDFFESLEAIKISDGTMHYFSNEDCQFDYRSSIFKTTAKGQYFITSVRFRLQKKHNLQLRYGAIQTKLEIKNISSPTIKDVSDVVIDIRKSKLPDPSVMGNAGSFFKNPIVTKEAAQKIAEDFPDMPMYPAGEGFSKLSAGWLIERSGWKGKQMGGAACYENHALILINKEEATSVEIKALAAAIQDSVKAKFDVELVPEVNFITANS